MSDTPNERVVKRDARGRIMPGSVLAPKQNNGPRFDRKRLIAILGSEDYEPIREIIRISRSENAPLYLRFECAREIAGYVYAKRRSVVINDGESDATIRIQWDDTAQHTVESTVQDSVSEAILADDDDL